MKQMEGFVICRIRGICGYFFNYPKSYTKAIQSIEKQAIKKITRTSLYGVSNPIGMSQRCLTSG